MSRISGKVLKYGDSIDTDVILAAKYLLAFSTRDSEELGKHAMETIDPEFPKKVRSSPILVGGKNFGCGSSREHAPVALKTAGTSLILAESFGRIFFRNSINIGLPLIVCQNISSKVQEGEELEVDIATGEITNISTGQTLRGEKLPDLILDLLNWGGLIPRRIKQLRNAQREINSLGDA